MSDTFFALRAAVFTHLTSDTALQALCGNPLRLYDLSPEDAAFPYIAFSGVEARDASTKTIAAQSVLLTLTIASRERGFKEAERIGAALRHRLHDASLTLSTGYLARCQFEFMGLGREADGLATLGQLRLRCVISAS
jgi:Protein of unknown function (DUF3168)